MKKHNMDDKIIGRRMLINAIRMEESLAQILRMEVKVLRRQMNTKEDFNHEDMQSVNKIIKHIIFSLTVLNDRIEAGLELLKK